MGIVEGPAIAVEVVVIIAELVLIAEEIVLIHKADQAEVIQVHQEIRGVLIAHQVEVILLTNDVVHLPEVILRMEDPHHRAADHRAADHLTADPVAVAVAAIKVAQVLQDQNPAVVRAQKVHQAEAEAEGINFPLFSQPGNCVPNHNSFLK